MIPIFTPSSSTRAPLGVWRQPLLEGDAGVEQTINRMRELVDEALRDPEFVRAARDIVQAAPDFDDFSEAAAAYDWVKSKVRFTKDPVNKEVLTPPAELLAWIRQSGRAAGDCDDISMLLGALLLAVGIPARLITVAASPSSPEQFSHVYVEAELPAGSGHWVPVDPARYDSRFGVAPPMFYRSRWWSLSDSSYGDLSGIGRFIARPYSGLGHYPRFRARISGMGSYGRVRARTIGQTDGSDQRETTSALIAQVPLIEQGAANIIAAAKGSPYGSFETGYTPGYGIPRAGYGGEIPVTGGGAFFGRLSTGAWILIGIVGAALIFGRR